MTGLSTGIISDIGDEVPSCEKCGSTLYYRPFCFNCDTQRKVVAAVPSLSNFDRGYLAITCGIRTVLTRSFASAENPQALAGHLKKLIDWHCRWRGRVRRERDVLLFCDNTPSVLCAEGGMYHNYFMSGCRTELMVYLCTSLYENVFSPQAPPRSYRWKLASVSVVDALAFVF